MREETADMVEEEVGQEPRQELEFVETMLYSRLKRVGFRQAACADMFDRKKDVFPVALSYVENVTVHVLAHLGQLFEFGQNLLAELGEFIGLISSNEEDLLFFREWVGVDSHRKGGDFTRAAAELEKAFRVGVVAVRQISCKITNTAGVFSVRGGSVLLV